METMRTLQITDPFGDNFDIRTYMENKRKQLVQSEWFHVFVGNNPLLQDEKFRNRLIQRETTTLESCMKDDMACQCCRGLDFCPCTHGRGKRQEVTVDHYGELTYTVVPCQYAKIKAEKEAYLRKFLLSDRPTSDFYRSLKDILKTYPGSNKNDDYVMTVRQVIQSMNHNRKGILLYGNIGVGKTYICQAAANEYAKRGNTVGFVQMQNLVEMVKQEFDRPDERGKTLRLATEVDVLFLDDLGAEMMTDFTRDAVLMKILDARCLSQKKTYITTNLDQDKYCQDSIVKHYADRNRDGKIMSDLPGARIADRIRALTTPICVQGSSARGF